SLPTHADSVRAQACVNTAAFDFHDAIMSRLRPRPEVVSLSPVLLPPFAGGGNVYASRRVVADGQTEEQGATGPFYGAEAVSSDFFRTMDVPILSGRAFTPADREDAPRVAVLTESVARSLWPNQSAIGRRFHYPGK